MNSGKLYVVGVGPGHHDHMTFRAKQVIEESQIIVGYETYVSLVEDLISGKEVYRYPMTQEVDRANQAIKDHGPHDMEAAAGRAFARRRAQVRRSHGAQARHLLPEIECVLALPRAR